MTLQSQDGQLSQREAWMLMVSMRPLLGLYFDSFTRIGSFEMIRLNDQQFFTSFYIKSL